VISRGLRKGPKLGREAVVPGTAAPKTVRISMATTQPELAAPSDAH